MSEKKRIYRIDFMRPGGFMNWPELTVRSHHKIRPVCFWMFYRWFGLHPTNWWHRDGFMAEAWDRRGNRIIVVQINNNHLVRHGSQGEAA